MRHACERLAFAIEPRPDFPPHGVADLDEAVRLVQPGLEVVRKAFKEA
jgi:hypothetical protein